MNGASKTQKRKQAMDFGLAKYPKIQKTYDSLDDSNSVDTIINWLYPDGFNSDQYSSSNDDNNIQFDIVKNLKSFEHLPLLSPQSFSDRMNLELSLIAGLLQHHLWLHTLNLDPFIVKEPISDTYSQNCYFVQRQENEELQKLRERLRQTTDQYSQLQMNSKQLGEFLEKAKLNFDQALKLSTERILEIEEMLTQVEKELDSKENEFKYKFEQATVQLKETEMRLDQIQQEYDSQKIKYNDKVKQLVSMEILLSQYEKQADDFIELKKAMDAKVQTSLIKKVQNFLFNNNALSNAQDVFDQFMKTKDLNIINSAFEQEYNIKKERAQKQIDVLVAERDDLLRDKRNRDLELKTLTKRLSEQINQYKTLTQNYNTTLNKLKKMESDQQMQLDQIRNSYEIQIDQFKQALDRCQQDKNYNTTQIQNLQTNLNRLMNEKNKLANEQKVLVQQLNTAEQQLQQVQLDKNDLVKKAAEAGRQLRLLKNASMTTGKSQIEINTLQQKIINLEDQLLKQQNTSLKNSNDLQGSLYIIKSLMSRQNSKIYTDLAKTMSNILDSEEIARFKTLVNNV